MNFQIFNEVRKSKIDKYKTERFEAMINMDAVAVVVTEEYRNVDCFHIFMTGGWSLYVEGTPRASQILHMDLFDAEDGEEDDEA